MSLLIVGIILAIVAVIFCSVAAVVNFWNETPGSGVAMLLLAVLNLFVLIDDIGDYRAMKNGELKIETVENVVMYQVDSTTIINGADTTKTYKITYWQNYK